MYFFIIVDRKFTCFSIRFQRMTAEYKSLNESFCKSYMKVCMNAQMKGQIKVYIKFS